MLKKLVFKNYRCFEDSEISLRNIAILVKDVINLLTK